MEAGYLGNWLLLLISRHPISHLEKTSNYDVAFRFPMLKTIKKEADQLDSELSTVQSGASSPEEEEAWSGQGSGVSSPEVQHKQQQKNPPCEAGLAVSDKLSIAGDFYFK